MADHVVRKKKLARFVTKMNKSYTNKVI